MSGVEGSNQSDQSMARRRGPFQDALQPGDLTHHVLVRDVPLQTVPWIVRELRRRLYEVHQTSESTRCQCISMRQGFPLWWSAALFALGWFLLTAFLVTGSDLGRGFQLLDGSGSAAHAAAPVLFHPLMRQASHILLWGGLALLTFSLFMAMCPRKHVFLVAQRNHSNQLDLWISGTSWRQERQFNREFRHLSRRIELHSQRASHNEPQASHQGP